MHDIEVADTKPWLKIRNPELALISDPDPKFGSCGVQGYHQKHQNEEENFSKLREQFLRDIVKLKKGLVAWPAGDPGGHRSGPSTHGLMLFLKRLSNVENSIISFKV